MGCQVELTFGSHSVEMVREVRVRESKGGEEDKENTPPRETEG